LSVRFTNQFYAVCPTYPRIFVSAAKLSEDEIIELSQFRTKGRFPVVSWCSPVTGTSLWRCAQPKAMLGRSMADEKLLNKLLTDSNAIDSETGNKRKLLIVDARPFVNAFANKAVGAGYESTGASSTYKSCTISFASIPNVHAVRESFDKMTDAVEALPFEFGVDDGPPEYSDGLDTMIALKAIHESKWLRYLRTILEGASMLVKELTVHRSNALVHCTDGWDRTAQLTGLVLLCVDPHYRTGVGLVQLIIKEFIQAGHQFRKRNGREMEDTENDRNQHRSPVFFQWLSCVALLQHYSPEAFEFNSKFLGTIADEVEKVCYGSFVGNCEKDRQSYSDGTRSFWYDLLAADGYQQLFLRDDLIKDLTCLNESSDKKGYDPKLTYGNSSNNIVLWSSLLTPTTEQWLKKLSNNKNLTNDRVRLWLSRSVGLVSINDAQCGDIYGLQLISRMKSHLSSLWHIPLLNEFWLKLHSARRT